MLKRNYLSFAMLAIALSTGIILCAYGETPERRSVVSLNALQLNVDYRIVEEGGFEVYLIEANACHPHSSEHCTSQTIGCYFYTGPGTVNCTYCNATSGTQDRWCVASPDSDGCLGTGTGSIKCGVIVNSTCVWAPTKMCATAAPTTDVCWRKSCQGS